MAIISIMIKVLQIVLSCFLSMFENGPNESIKTIYTMLQHSSSGHGRVTFFPGHFLAVRGREVVFIVSTLFPCSLTKYLLYSFTSVANLDLTLCPLDIYPAVTYEGFFTFNFHFFTSCSQFSYSPSFNIGNFNLNKLKSFVAECGFKANFQFW